MAAILNVNGVGKRFGGLQALSDVSFVVEPATVVGLMGPNGAGKTTLFNVIAGVYAPDQGAVLLNGVNICGWRTNRICRAGIGRTFQITKPFANLTVLETVRIGALNHSAHLRAATREAEMVLDRVGLLDKREQLGKQLTVVERKRLEVARALATRPHLLLLDEVAAGLRPHEIEQIGDLVRSLAREGIAILMIEHVVQALMSVSSHIILLDHGEILAEGPPDVIVRDPKVIDVYLGQETAVA
ncbi:MAG: ABC transporter ATP-binding protein [Rhodospirillales bacterium]|nr:ABC transporter ATP-binding protein [Rhodospirillales bacterium]